MTEKKPTFVEEFKLGLEASKNIKMHKMELMRERVDVLSIPMCNEIYKICSEKCIKTFTTKQLDQDEIGCLKDCAGNIEQFNSAFNTCTPYVQLNPTLPK